jgi:hypothetical protein
MNKDFIPPGKQKVFTKLLGLNYKIIYKKGVKNKVADALSRKPIDQTTCHAMSVCQPDWIQQIVASYEHDDLARDMISKLVIDASTVPHYTWSQGLLQYKNKLWIGVAPELKLRLIFAFHDSTVGGHSGTSATYRRLTQVFAWKSMKSTIQEYVQSCMICQQAKPNGSKLPGLLQPLAIPSESWQVISMDFIDGLP